MLENFGKHVFTKRPKEKLPWRQPAMWSAHLAPQDISSLPSEFIFPLGLLSLDQADHSDKSHAGYVQ